MTQTNRIAEFGTFDPALLAKATRLAQAPSRHTPGLVFYLEHLSAGYAIAGSCARWDAECWRVSFHMDGARHGQRFASEIAARAFFNSRTLSNGAPAELEA